MQCVCVCVSNLTVTLRFYSFIRNTVVLFVFAACDEDCELHERVRLLGLSLDYCC